VKPLSLNPLRAKTGRDLYGTQRNKKKTEKAEILIGSTESKYTFKQ